MQSFVTYLEKTVSQKQQRKFIEEVAHSTPDIIYVLDLKERKIVFINERVSNILGYDPQEVYNMGSKFFLKKLHPDDYLRRMQHLTACIDMQESETRTIDVRLRVKVGGWRWFRIRDIPFRFSDGKVSQTIGVARDVHELKQAEDDLHHNELLLRTAINLIPNPLQAFKSVRNSKGEIIDFEWIILNEASSDYTGHVVGKSLTKKYPGIITSGLFDKYKHVVDTGTPLSTQLNYEYDNLNMWVHLYAAKMNDGFVVIAYNLSGEGRLQKPITLPGNLPQPETDIDKVAAIDTISKTIAHEIRNPLNNISLSVHMLRQELQGNQPENVILNDFATVISRNCDKIDHLLKELVSRSTVTDIPFVTTELSELIEQALVMAGDRIRLKGIKVEKQIDPACFIRTDPERMKIALLNIIINAVEAMEEIGGILEIIAKKNGPEVSLSINDNGCGMTEEQMNKMFDPYYTSKSNGLGLGLANVKSIFEKSGAIFQVTSEPNKGTKFTITYMCADKTPSLQA